MFEVKAYDDDHSLHSWRFVANPDQPIHNIAQRWARRYNIVDNNAVGLEIEPRMPVDLQKTARELGWYKIYVETQEAVALWAVPLADCYADPNDIIDLESPRNVPGPAIPDEFVQHGTANELINAMQSKPGVLASKAEEPKLPEPSPKATVPRRSKGIDDAIEKSDLSQWSDYGGIAGEDPIEMAPNPKRLFSHSYERYELYKKARTINEALQLGARTGDIKYDMQHGYIKKI